MKDMRAPQTSPEIQRYQNIEKVESWKLKIMISGVDGRIYEPSTVVDILHSSIYTKEKG